MIQQDATEMLHWEAKRLSDLRKYKQTYELLSRLPRRKLLEDTDLCLLQVRAMSHLHRHKESLELLSEAEPYFLASHDEAVIRRWRNGYAIHLSHTGRIKEARELLVTSLESADLDNDQRSIAYICNTLGVFASTCGEIELAVQYYNRSIAAWQRIGDEHCVCLGHYNLGVVFREWNRIEEATKHFFLAQEYGSGSATAEEKLMMSLERSMLSLALGDGVLAETTARAALEKAGAIANESLISRAQRVLGAVLLAMGRAADARFFLEEALRKIAAEPNRLIEAEINEDLAFLAFKEGRRGEAERHLASATSYYVDIGADNQRQRLEQRFAEYLLQPDAS